MLIAHQGLAAEATAELELSDPKTLVIYGDDDTILRDSSVLVRRVPALRPNALQAQAVPAVQPQVAGSTPKASASLAAGHTAAAGDSQPAADAAFGGDLYSDKPVEEAVPEADDMAAKMQAFADQQQSSWKEHVAVGQRQGFQGGRGFGRGGRSGSCMPLDLAERECHRCGQKGHLDRDCPTLGDPAFDKKRVRLPAGIPVGLVSASGDGALLMPDGTMGSLMANEDAFQKEVAALLPPPASDAASAPALTGPPQRPDSMAALPAPTPTPQLAAAAAPLQLAERPHDGAEPAAQQPPVAGTAAGQSAVPRSPLLAGEEFLPMPFAPAAGGAGFPFPVGVLPEGPMGLVLQAFTADKPLTPEDWQRLQQMQAASATNGRSSSRRRSRSPSRGRKRRSPKRERQQKSSEQRRHAGTSSRQKRSPRASSCSRPPKPPQPAPAPMFVATERMPRKSDADQSEDQQPMSRQGSPPRHEPQQRLPAPAPTTSRSPRPTKVSFAQPALSRAARLRLCSCIYCRFCLSRATGFHNCNLAARRRAQSGHQCPGDQQLRLPPNVCKYSPGPRPMALTGGTTMASGPRPPQLRNSGCRQEVHRRLPATSS